VFGFGAAVTVDAGIKADVFDPLHIQGDFSVAIDLPWPLPSSPPASISNGDRNP
jgi:hypothetical protein